MSQTLAVISHLYDVSVILRRHRQRFLSYISCDNEAVLQDWWDTAEQNPTAKNLLELSTLNLMGLVTCKDSQCYCQRRGSEMRTAANELSKLNINLVSH